MTVSGLTLHVRPPWVYFREPFRSAAHPLVRECCSVADREGVVSNYYDLTQDRFPIGLISRCYWGLHARGWPPILDDCPAPVRMPDASPTKAGRTPYTDQLVAADTCATRLCGIVQAGTSAGKSLVMALVARDHPHARVLVVTPRRELADQTADDEFSPHLAEEIGRCNASVWEPRRITVAMLQTLQRRAKRGPDRPPPPPGSDLDPMADYDADATRLLLATDILMVDEPHLNMGPETYWMLNLTRARMRLGFTGTPFGRNKPVQNFRMEALFGPPIFSLPTSELIRAGRAAGVRCWFVDYGKAPAGDTEWPASYTDFIIRNEARNRVAVALALSSGVKGRPAVVTFSKHEHGDALASISRTLGYDPPVVDDRTTSADRKAAYAGLNAGTFPVLCTSKVSEVGLNIPRIRTIVNARGEQADQGLLQYLGRGIRLKRDDGEEVVDWIDFDDRHPWTMRRHSEQRAETMKAEGHPVRYGIPDWAR